MNKIIAIGLLGISTICLTLAEEKQDDFPYTYKKIDPQEVAYENPQFKAIVQRLIYGAFKERSEAISEIVQQKPLSEQNFNLLMTTAMNDIDKRVRSNAVWRLSMCDKEHLPATAQTLISLFKSTTSQRQKAISAFLAMTSMHPDVEKVVETDPELYKQLKPEIEKNLRHYDISKLFEIKEALDQYKSAMNELPENLSELVKKGYLKNMSSLTSRVSKQAVTMEMLENNTGDFIFIPPQKLTEKLKEKMSAAPLVISKPGIYGDSYGRILTHGGYLITFEECLNFTELKQMGYVK